MANLHQQFTEFNSTIKLTNARKDSLVNSRKAIRKKIRVWFKENKDQELQPKFWGQGSFEMNTITNPIPTTDKDRNELRKYDLDDGVYFIENDSEGNKRSIDTYHDWIYQAVEGHTNTPPIKKTTCVRVVFSDGHHIDLPIYYKKEGNIELAHKSKGWLTSDPKSFYEWFNNKKNKQLERIVRYLKAWKNYREFQNTNLKLPSGFELTILATNNYQEHDNDDTAFRNTIIAINNSLNELGGFKCIRPTTPIEDVFADYSPTRKSNFLDSLKSLVKACQDAENEPNKKTASELMQKQFGDRFPTGPDEIDQTCQKNIDKALMSSIISPKPYRID